MQHNQISIFIRRGIFQCDFLIAISFYVALNAMSLSGTEYTYDNNNNDT